MPLPVPSFPRHPRSLHLLYCDVTGHSGIDSPRLNRSGSPDPASSSSVTSCLHHSSNFSGVAHLQAIAARSRNLLNITCQLYRSPNTAGNSPHPDAVVSRRTATSLRVSQRIAAHAFPPPTSLVLSRESNRLTSRVHQNPQGFPAQRDLSPTPSPRSENLSNPGNRCSMTQTANLQNPYAERATMREIPTAMTHKRAGSSGATKRSPAAIGTYQPNRGQHRPTHSRSVAR